MFAPDRIGNELDPIACLELLDAHKVAAHFVIARDGSLWHVVPEDKRAWHAGQSALPGGRAGVNDFSLGVELIGPDTAPFTESQYRSLALLTSDLLSRHPLRYILGHEHIAVPPGRKTDPGPHFDWLHFQAILVELGVRTQSLIFPPGPPA